MKIINTYRLKFKSNLYIRMLTLYSTVVIISLFIIFYFSYQHQTTNIKTQKFESYANTIEQFKIFSDQYVLNEVYSIITKELFTSNVNNLDIINDSKIYEYNKNNFNKILELKKLLLNLHSNTDFINSIEIYNKEYDTYISSTKGVFYDVSTNHNLYKDFINYDFINPNITETSGQFWRTPSDNQYFPNYQDTVSLVQMLPIFLSPEVCDIVFIINLDIEKAYSSYFSKINTSSENFKILDGANQLIFDTNKEQLYEPNLDEEFVTAISSADSGNHTLHINNKKHNIIWASSSINDWKYIYTITYNDLFGAIKSSTLQISILLLVIFIICLLAISTISKWLYTPVRQLVALSRNKLSETSSDSDLLIINKAFSNLNTQLG